MTHNLDAKRSLLPETDWPIGKGELAGLIRNFDWASTSLGPIEGWSETMKSAIDLMLASPVPISTLWGPESLRIYNDAYADFSGERHPALLGSPVHEGWDEVSNFNMNVIKVVMSGRTLIYKDQYLKLSRSGESEDIWLDLYYSPIPDKTGKPEGVLTILSETTGRVLALRRQQEQEQLALNIAEQLRQASVMAQDANMAKTEFLANMSHEIRTPMNAIVGLAHILAGSAPLTPRQKECITTLQGSADALLTLLNDMLDISKIEARAIQLESIPFDLGRTIEDVIKMMGVLARNKGLRLTMDADSVQGRMFMGDPARIRQILTNLCGNAIKFTHDGGVDISVACLPPASPETQKLRIDILDTGIGIPPERLENVFEKFVQADQSMNRKYGGTGLGLAISRALVEAMGGTITVESRVGEGTIFAVTLDLPLARQTVSAQPDAAMQTNAPRATGRVLIVDDHAPNILVASTMLEEFGYPHDTAGNGREAVEKVKAGDYGTVLMDVQMSGMDGLTATQMIRAHEAETGRARHRIIGMTAHALIGDRERCFQAGMDDYIAKPFNPQELKNKLDAGRTA